MEGLPFLYPSPAFALRRLTLRSAFALFYRSFWSEASLGMHRAFHSQRPQIRRLRHPCHWIRSVRGKMTKCRKRRVKDSD